MAAFPGFPDNVDGELNDLGSSLIVARMPTQIPTGTRAENLAYTGPAGTVTYDTDELTVRFHDGVNAGGKFFSSKTFGCKAIRSADKAAITTGVKWDPDGVIWQNKFNGLSFWLGADFVFVDADVTVASDSIAETGHGMITGDGPFDMVTSGTLPAGLAVSTEYWCIRVDDNNFKVALSYALATAGTAVDITSAGSGGNHTVARETRLVVPHGIIGVRIDCGMGWDNDLDNRTLQVFKNGTAEVTGGPMMVLSEMNKGTGNSNVRAQEQGSFTDLTTDGDFYQMQVGSVNSLSLLSKHTHFGITSLSH